jgi:hypothetical protein
MGYWIVDGRKLTDEEYAELQKREELKRQRVEEETTQLARDLGEAYTALKEHLRAHADTDRRVTSERSLDQEIYQKLWHNLERANKAPRCSAIKEDGTRCGAPKMKTGLYCYAHVQMAEARAEKLALPALEDANAIQMAVMLVQKALIDDEISEKKAGLLLYSIQIAAANVGKTTFGKAPDEEMVTDCVTEDEGTELYTRSQEKGKTIEAIRQGRDKNGPSLPSEDTELMKAGAKILPQAIDSGGGLGTAMG